VLDHRHQHVLEAPGDMGPDGLALEGADEPARAGLGHRHREVVGPELRQPLGKGPGRQGGGEQPGACIGLDQAAEVFGKLQFSRAHVGVCSPVPPCTLELRESLQPQRGAGQIAAMLCGGWSHLHEQPAARVGRDVAQPGLAQPEAVCSDARRGVVVNGRSGVGRHEASVKRPSSDC
jgi:hypothetical protein